MITHTDYKYTPLSAGYRGPLRDKEFFRKPELNVEYPLDKCEFIMNRRNKILGLEPVTVDLDGSSIDPLDATNLSRTMNLISAMFISQDDASSSYDGVSLVLPHEPKPLVKVNGKKLYLVAGLYKNSCETKYEWDHATNSQKSSKVLSDTFTADMISLGSPLYGLSPTGERNYFFGLCEYPIVPFEDEDKSIFSYGGVIAIGATFHSDYREKGIDSEIKKLPPSALKLIEKWRQEAANNAI